MNPTDLVILSATRTPIGAFQGSLASAPAPRLGATAIRGALEKAGITAAEVDEVFLGQVLQAGVGQAPARQAARLAGLPDGARCTTVHKVCGSGLQAVILVTTSSTPTANPIPPSSISSAAWAARATRERRSDFRSNDPTASPRNTRRLRKPGDFRGRSRVSRAQK